MIFFSSPAKVTGAKALSCPAYSDTVKDITVLHLEHNTASEHWANNKSSKAY